MACDPKSKNMNFMNGFNYCLAVYLRPLKKTFQKETNWFLRWDGQKVHQWKTAVRTFLSVKLCVKSREITENRNLGPWSQHLNCSNALEGVSARTIIPGYISSVCSHLPSKRLWVFTFSTDLFDIYHTANMLFQSVVLRKVRVYSFTIVTAT